MTKAQKKNSDKDHCRPAGNDYFFYRGDDGNAGFILTAGGYPEMKRFLHSPDSFLDEGKILKDSRTTKAGIIEIDSRKYFLKRYNNKGLVYALKYLFRKPRPLNALRAAQAIRKLGIPCPEVVAALSRRRRRILQSCYLLTENLENIIPPEEYILESAANPDIYTKFQSRMCAYLKKMHDAGIRHGDLKLSNIYCRKDPDGLEFGLFDFDGTDFLRKPLSQRMRVKEYARIISSWIIISGNINVPVDREKIIRGFNKKYFECNGIEMDIARLNKLVDYYLNRKRKY
jgi:tRNA A-37 threonylcarbamoyl transferase component Bud32